MSATQEFETSFWSADKKGEIIELLPMGLLAYDRFGTIIYANNNVVKFGVLKPNAPVSLLGKNLLKNDFIENFSLQNYIASLMEKDSFDKELKSSKTIDGGFISVVVKGFPLFNENEFDGGVLIIEDILIPGTEETNRDTHLKDSFQILLNHAFDFIAITDINGAMLFSSGKSKHLFLTKGKPVNELNLFDIFPEKDTSTAQTSFDNAINNRKETSFIVELENFENRISFEVVFSPLLSDKHKTNFISCYFRDITEHSASDENRKQIIRELSQYQIITEAAMDAVVTLNSNGQIVFWNNASNQLFGYTKSEIFGKEFGKLLNSYDDSFFESVLTSLKNEKSVKNVLPFITKKSKKRTGNFTFSKTLFENTEEVIVVLCEDVTEKEIFEKELRLSEERFRNIVQSASDLICNFDANGKILYTNPAFLEKLKLSEKEIKRVKITDFFDPEFLGEKHFNIKTLIKEKHLTFELPVFSTQGDKLFLQANFSTVYDADESIKFFNGIFTDISLKKNTEQELLMMRSIFDASNDGIAMELDGKVVLANDSFAKIFGYETGLEMEGLQSIELVADEDKKRVEEYSSARLFKEDAPKRYEFLGKRKDGDFSFIEMSVTYFSFNEKTFFVAFARDITERKRAQQAIKESEQRYRSIAEHIDDFFWTAERIDDKLRTMFYTASVEKVTGYTQTEFLTDSRLFFKIIYPDDYANVKSRLKKLFENFYKQNDELEFRIINKQGNIVWIRNKFSVVRETSGKIKKIFGLVSDISLQKKAQDELKDFTQNLQKLNETKDRFISIISHDLRTPFSSILGFTDLLLDDDDLTPAEKRQYISFIQDSSNSMLALVNSLLDWTRLQTGRIKFEPEKIDIRKIIKKSFASLAGTALQKNISLIDSIQSELHLFVDQSLILQVFNNLLSNALKFTNNGGSITVSASQCETARFIQITVKDTGVGIAQENLDKIFNVDSKFTSEGTAGEKGTGLGLSLVYEIIENHGGKIWIESELGIGTEFKFTLPKASANILLVDDSSTDRILYSKLIRSIATEYEIIVAASGSEALKLVESAVPALIITDHDMPEMTGVEFVKKLNASDVKGKPQIIVLSGGIGKSEELEFNELGVEYVFHKPVNISAFKDAIEKSLKKLPV